MVCAHIAEAVLRDERIVIPIGSYHPSSGVTLSMPSVLGREGVVHILEPDLAENERQALQRSAEALKSAVARMKGESLIGFPSNLPRASDPRCPANSYARQKDFARPASLNPAQ